MTPLWVIGDIHGSLDKLRLLLHLAGLIDESSQWSGEQAHLVFLGDYFDRGPQGLGVIRLIQQLEQQAAQTGGRVSALLGNHEVMFLAAQRFLALDPGDHLGFYEYWSMNGGQKSDLDTLNQDDLAWLLRRPALLQVDQWLLAHADSLFYLQLGDQLEAINAKVGELLLSPEPAQWSAFANAFVERLHFAQADGAQQVQQLLDRFGSERLVHGHTPTYLLINENGQQLENDPAWPIVYADGKCINIDSGMAYIPHAGFMVSLGRSAIQKVVSLPAHLFTAKEPEE